MRTQLLAALSLIPILLALKKSLHALALIPLTHKGMQVAANGGNFNPYLIAMIGIVVSIALPLGVLQAFSE